MSDDRPFLKKDFSGLVRSLLGELTSNQNGQAVFTDDTEGSVIRTLVEAFSRELAVTYEQLETVYRNGYLDTAEGIALENVVALLGIKRRRAGRIEGKVTFSRSTPAPNDIVIPARIRVTGHKLPLFETVGDTTLKKGDPEVDVRVRSLEPYEQKVKAESIDLMPRPVIGIEKVSNPHEFLPKKKEETDQELRERARLTHKGIRQGTVPALNQLVSSLGFSKVRIQEQLPEKPGMLEIIIGDLKTGEEGILDWVRDLVEEVRPAGIKINVRGVTRILVLINATLMMDKERPPHEKKAIEAELSQKLVNYFSNLGPNENVFISKVRNILTGNDAVMELTNTTEGERIIYSFEVGENGEFKERTDLLLKNGDIFIGPAERAVLDLEKKPLMLTLEPPGLDVWVDVKVKLKRGGENGVSEKEVKQRLNVFLDNANPNESISYNKWIEALSSLATKIQSIIFIVIHDRDGRVTELKDDNDSARFDDREIPQLRHIEIIPAESY